MLIRELVAATDLAALAALLNRNSYGPAGAGQPLTAESMGAIIQERCPILILVAERGGAIVGSLGFFLGSGRRVAARGECFAGMFIIDHVYRDALLAGSMFTTGFESLIARGIRTLRTEANPANTRASSIYHRAGFRSLPNAVADEDGYVELISQLPGVVADLQTSDLPIDLRRALAKTSWRNLASNRRASAADGVECTDGDWRVCYELQAAGRTMRAVVGLLDGTVHAYDMPADITGLLPYRAVSVPPSPTPDFTAQLNPTTVVRVNSHGILTIEAQGHLGPVLTEAPPVILGVAPPGWRRPARVRPAIEPTASGCHISYALGAFAIARQVDVGEGTLSVRTDVTGPTGEYLVAPWIAMRQGTKRVLLDNQCVEGPVVPGVWPVTYTDFEAAADFLAGSAAGPPVQWQGANLRLIASWSAARQRHEGRHLPLLRSPIGEPICYSVRVEASGPDDPAMSPCVTPPGILPEARQTSSNPSPSPDGQYRWSRSRGRHNIRVLESQMARLVYSADAGGLVEWLFDDHVILRATFPGARAFGSFPILSCALWAADAAPRESPEQGVEWGAPGGLAFGSGNPEDPESEPVAGAPVAGAPVAGAVAEPVAGSWTAQFVENDPRSILLMVQPSSASIGRDLTFSLLPNTAPGEAVMIAQHGQPWLVEATAEPWSASATAAAVPIKYSGNYLAVWPVRANHPETFVRSTGGGVMLTLLHRVTDHRHGAIWQLRVCDTRDQALQHLCGAQEGTDHTAATAYQREETSSWR